MVQNCSTLSAQAARKIHQNASAPSLSAFDLNRILKSRMQDFSFDKFMDDILLKEAERAKRAQELEAETPQREYARKYRETPANRTRVK